MSTVQYSPFTAIFEDKAPGTAIIGTPGSGKTFFTLNVISNALMMEQRVFGIDPKNDLGIISEIYPEVEYIDINNIVDGALNPFKVLKNLDTNTLLSIISIQCGGLTDVQTTAITPILNDFINRHKRFKNENLSFSNIADYLYANDNEHAQTIGNKLYAHKDSQYGRLIFGNSERSINFDLKSKIISLHGMDLPKFNAKIVTEEQRFNSGIVYIICKMLRDLLVNNGYPTLFIMDEASIALKNETFSTIIDEFLALGRSLNIATILATQNASHLPEGISQMVSNKFCFKSSTSEASKFLDLFFNKDNRNAVDFTSIINKIGDFEKGECFYIDSENRSGFFKVVSLFGNDITSNPLMKKKKKSAK